MPLRLDGLTLTLTGAEKTLRRRIADRLGVPAGRVTSFRIARRSLDVRDRQRIRWVYSVVVQLADESEALRRLRGDRDVHLLLESEQPFAPPPLLRAMRPVIVGAGPAGLFAADALARRGAPPLVLERGRPVEQRDEDVRRLFTEARLDPESNICFGEGGAGTYSDGKLTTRIGHPLVRHVLQTFVDLGAPGDVLYDAAPHLGSDRLPGLVRAMRERLIQQGVEFRFDAKVTDVAIEDGRLRGLVLADGSTIEADAVLFAIGHSAADLVRALHRRGVAIEPKGFAVGVRIEHEQRVIDQMQYGRAAGHPRLPPATYRLTHRGPGGRGVYSFCMCPGGMILPSATDAGHLVINGGSNAARSGERANAALVVAVGPDDFGAEPLAGLAFREALEAQAASGEALRAPAQRVVDFLAGRTSRDLPPVSYPLGVAPANLHDVLPPLVREGLLNALRRWGARRRGFTGAGAVLVGVETRTSSPWRLVRNEQFESVNVRGLYVAGEGAGYAGGIVSSAVDGLRAALGIS